jgi:hypothetical protein
MIKDYTWSYQKLNVPLPVKIEYLIKYGELDEIKTAIKKYGFDRRY